MKQQVLITDLTRMGGDRVCVAGVTSDGRSVRPCLPHSNITESWLWNAGSLVVRPFAVVELDILGHNPSPPHTEDWIINDQHLILVELKEEAERKRALEGICDPSLDSIFGADIHCKETDNLREGCWI